MAAGALKVSDQAKIVSYRGFANYGTANLDGAIRDWSHVVDLHEAPLEQVAKALVNRGIVWGQKGDTDKELADYSRIIDKLPGAPVEQIAKALFSRGVTWRKKGDSDKARADYTRVIDLPGAPAEAIAMARAARARR